MCRLGDSVEGLCDETVHRWRAVVMHRDIVARCVEESRLGRRIVSVWTVPASGKVLRESLDDECSFEAPELGDGSNVLCKPSVAVVEARDDYARWHRVDVSV